MATVQTCCRHICISRSIPARPPIKQVRLKRNASSAHRFALEGNGHRISLGGHFRHHLGRIRSAFHAGHLLLHPFNISHHCRHSIYPPFRVWCCHCTWTVIKGKIARGYMTISINVLMGVDQVAESWLLFIHLRKLTTTNHKGVI